MSTTGNEYEQPGVNYPDRGDGPGAGTGADGAERDEQVEAAPTMGEPAPDSQPAGTWTEAPEQGGGAPPSSQGGSESGVDSPAADDSAVPSADPAGSSQGAAATLPSSGALSGEPSHEAVGVGVIDGQDHHGHDDGRDTMTVSQAQQTPGGLGSEQEQRLPAMSQNNASDLEKVTGIVAQTRQDVGTEPQERIADVLRQRLEQAGVTLPDSDVQELARQVSTGDADDPAEPGRSATS